MEPYEWTNAVPEDKPEFQGLLEEEKPVAYPEVSAKLTGVDLESEEADVQVVTDKPEPDFAELAVTALDNAGVDPANILQFAQDVVANTAPAAVAQLPAIVEANDKEVMYKIMFDLPDVGLGDHVVPPDAAIPANALVDVPVHAAAAAAIVADMVPKAKRRQYPT
jgi:hypothetical protein